MKGKKHGFGHGQSVPLPHFVQSPLPLFHTLFSPLSPFTTLRSVLPSPPYLSFPKIQRGFFQGSMEELLICRVFHMIKPADTVNFCSNMTGSGRKSELCDSMFITDC